MEMPKDSTTQESLGMVKLHQRFKGVLEVLMDSKLAFSSPGSGLFFFFSF